MRTVRDNVEILGELKGKTHDFQRKHPAVAADLVANANRRIAEGKFDDAVARLYRAIELLGQCAFEQTLGVETGHVPFDKIPATLRDEFIPKYADGDAAKLPLFATYRVLEEIGHSDGKRFRESFAELRKVFDARNTSILAHGMNPVAEAAAKRLRELVIAFLPVPSRLPQFPRLPW